WDITIRMPDGERPSWLELSHSGRDVVVGQFVGIVGSARPISRVVVGGDSLHFAIPPQWESGNGDLTVDGRLTGGRLAGSMTLPDGKRYDWSGVRAPMMKRDHAPKWGTPIRLLHANDLGGWRAVGGEANQWVGANGVLRSPRSGGSAQAAQRHGACKPSLAHRLPAA